ncbi:MAG: hypothetical protein AAFO15_00135 [Pseudomonadota bacterium]
MKNTGNEDSFSHQKDVLDAEELNQDAQDELSVDSDSRVDSDNSEEQNNDFASDIRKDNIFKGISVKIRSYLENKTLSGFMIDKIIKHIGSLYNSTVDRMFREDIKKNIVAQCNKLEAKDQINFIQNRIKIVDEDIELYTYMQDMICSVLSNFSLESFNQMLAIQSSIEANLWNLEKEQKTLPFILIKYEIDSLGVQSFFKHKLKSNMEDFKWKKDNDTIVAVEEVDLQKIFYIFDAYEDDLKVLKDLFICDLINAQKSSVSVFKNFYKKETKMIISDKENVNSLRMMLRQYINDKDYILYDSELFMKILLFISNVQIDWNAWLDVKDAKLDEYAQQFKFENEFIDDYAANEVGLLINQQGMNFDTVTVILSTAWYKVAINNTIRKIPFYIISIDYSYKKNINFSFALENALIVIRSDWKERSSCDLIFKRIFVDLHGDNKGVLYLNHYNPIESTDLLSALHEKQYTKGCQNILLSACYAGMKMIDKEYCTDEYMIKKTLSSSGQKLMLTIADINAKHHGTLRRVDILGGRQVITFNSKVVIYNYFSNLTLFENNVIKGMFFTKHRFEFSDDSSELQHIKVPSLKLYGEGIRENLQIENYDNLKQYYNAKRDLFNVYENVLANKSIDEQFEEINNSIRAYKGRDNVEFNDYMRVLRLYYEVDSYKNSIAAKWVLNNFNFVIQKYIDVAKKDLNEKNQSAKDDCKYIAEESVKILLNLHMSQYELKLSEMEYVVKQIIMSHIYESVYRGVISPKYISKYVDIDGQVLLFKKAEDQDDNKLIVNKRQMFNLIEEWAEAKYGVVNWKMKLQIWRRLLLS